MRVRAGEPALYVLVALLAVGWIAGFTISVGGTPATPEDGYYPQQLIAATVIALPWFVAVRLLWRRWWARTGADLATLDAPAQLLAAAVAATPRHRRDWGAAMLAELDQVRDPAERWAFAVSSARAAAFPPRTRHAPPPAGFLVTAVGLAAVVACFAAVGYFLSEFPVAAQQLPPATAVLLAGLLTGAAWLVLDPPHVLVGSRLALYVGAGTAVGLSAVLWVLSQAGLDDVGPLSIGIAGFLFLAPVPVLLVGSLVTAFAGRSFRTGAQTAVWAAVLTSLMFFAVALLEAVRWFHVDSSLILAADGIPLAAVGENLRNFGWGLVLFPFWWLPFGFLGAALGQRIGTVASTRQR